ncbi:hypothetical protein RUM44_006560 [Polyplax serrata]|uniref:Uncharacterized protein n=1 Tax=Polyplax serrata TaxID=468196 RepID=A0ABR1AIE8_POLSC
MTDQDIRNAAEVLLAPTNTCHYNGLMPDTQSLCTHNHQADSINNSLSSLEGTHLDEVASGFRRNGRMSAVRRFFCCFVLFDLLLIALTWLICIVIIDSNNIINVVKQQVLHYSIITSLFDIVVASALRFCILLFFYGILHFNTTFFVAFTTFSTCLFLIFKVVYYSWATANEPAFHVIIILMSFIVSWLETWFFDFRVIPQELFAQQYAWSRGRFSESLNNLLFDPNLRNSVIRQFPRHTIGDTREESTGNFYSPLESPEGSDNESDENRIPSKLLNEELLQRGKDNLELAWNILNDNGWTLQKSTNCSESVFSKQHKQLGKFFLLRTTMNVKAETLLQDLFKNVDRLTTWNKSVLESRRLLVIDDHTDVTYQVSAPGGNGVITSRDFVNVRHWNMRGDSFVLAGISVPYPSLPSNKFYIRGENGPCCWAIKPLEGNNCNFQFLLNTDLKGWIPKYVFENAIISVLLDYSQSLKGHCTFLNRNGKT